MESLWKIYELYKNVTQKWTKSFFFQQQTLKMVTIKMVYNGAQNCPIGK